MPFYFVLFKLACTDAIVLEVLYVARSKLIIANLTYDIAIIKLHSSFSILGMLLLYGEMNILVFEIFSD